LKGDYYDNLDFTGTLKTRYDATINKAFNSSAPITGIQPTTYSVRWTGQIMPAFSETYTFTLSFADGARLMVNGQVLVNDWVDGAKRTKTGTVALQANTKYDIRLEYYRNATNPGAVKLEWQSSSRSKQVIPQASLFPTGTNAEVAWNVLKALPSGSGLSASFYPESAVTYRNGQEQFFYAAEKEQTATVLAVFKNGTVVYARRYKYAGQNLTVTNLQTGGSVDFGKISDYYDRDPSNDSIQKQRFQDKERALLQINFPILRITPQAVPSGFCPSCQVAQDKYYNSSILLAAYVWQTGLYYGLGFKDCLNKPSVDACVKGFLGGLATDLAIAGFKWNECKSNTKCPYALTQPNPTTLEFKLSVGESDTKSFELKNIGFWTMLVKESTNSTRLKLDASGASSPTDVVGVGNFRTLAQFAVMTVSVKATCEAGGEFTDTVTVAARASQVPDPDFNETREVTVKLTCEGPKISVSPSSISLEAGLNAYSDRGYFTIENSGKADLNITGISVDTTWVIFNRSTIENATSWPVAPGRNRSVIYNFSCGSQVETRQAVISVFHNDATTPNPIKITASLSCQTSPIFLTFPKTRFEQKGGCRASVCFDPPPITGDTSVTYTIKNVGSVPTSFVFGNGFFAGTAAWYSFENRDREPFYGITLQPGEERTYSLSFIGVCNNNGLAGESVGEVWRVPYNPEKVIILTQSLFFSCA
jgi:PA14 domain